MVYMVYYGYGLKNATRNKQQSGEPIYLGVRGGL